MHWTVSRNAISGKDPPEQVGEQYNIWELGDRLAVNIEPAFIKQITLKLHKKFSKSQLLYRAIATQTNFSETTIKQELKPSHRWKRDLNILVRACNELDLPLSSLQAAIISYGVRRGSILVSSPKLPILITPIFDMILAHHFGDGFAHVGKANRKTYFGYRQVDLILRAMYAKKLESLFGAVSVSTSSLSNIFTKERCPIAIAHLFFSVYKLSNEDFLSEKARVPDALFDRDRRHKLAFLLGFIIDEGYVAASYIVIRLKNTPLIHDLDRICKDLGYNTTTTMERNGIAGIYILSKSIEPLYADYVALLQKFPAVNLGWKGEELASAAALQNKPKIYLPGNRELFIQNLRREPMTVKQLAQTMSMTMQGVRYHIKGLINKQAIIVVRKAKWQASVYGVANVDRFSRGPVERQKYDFQSEHPS